MAGGLIEDSGAVLDPAPLLVVGSEINPPQPGERNCRGTHRAGLQRDIQIKIGQTSLSCRPGALPDDQHFRVISRIVGGLYRIPGPGNNLSRS